MEQNGRPYSGLNPKFVEKQPPYKEVGYNYVDLCTFFIIVKWGLCGGWGGSIISRAKSMINLSDIMKKKACYL